MGDNPFGSSVRISGEEAKSWRHQLYILRKRFTIAAGQAAYIVFNPSEGTAFPKEHFYLGPLIARTFGGGPVNIDTFYGTDYDTDGTLWAGIDINSVDAVSHHLKIRLNPTINDIGTQSPIEDASFSAGTGTPIAQIVPDSAVRDFSIHTPKDLVICVKLTNTDSSNAISGVFAAKWFEI